MNRNLPGTGGVQILYRLNDDPRGEIRTFVPSLKNVNQGTNSQTLGAAKPQGGTEDLGTWEAKAFSDFFQEVEKIESSLKK